eukprot:TRINITY_DN260_c0_g1_i3.p1 TRINITY_DN260_c0_g1~~TRINITY_DN260_c0_g1_i3.p1  ORF type:complete len:758 (-),score=262.72 TRINITY_DN260_c0_g1_i3:110-2290(-)
MSSSLLASLDALSRKRTEMAGITSYKPSASSPSYGQQPDSVLHDRIAFLEKVIVQILSRLSALEEEQIRSRSALMFSQPSPFAAPSAMQQGVDADTLASVDKVVRDALSEMSRVQGLYDNLRAEVDTLRSSSSSSSSSKTTKPSTTSTTTTARSITPPNNIPAPSPANTNSNTSANKPSVVPMKRQAPAPQPTSSKSVSFKPSGESDGPTRGLPAWQVEYPPGYNPHRGRRFSVAGESFNPTSTDFQDYERKVIRKSDDSRKRIRTVIRNNILFRSLDEEQIEAIIDEMFETTLKPEEVIIKQDDDGDNFYVVESGELYVLYKEVVVATIGAGKSFGEIALMYNCPRTATVKAKSECVLWGLGRTSFRRNLMLTAMKKRELYESFLERVPLLENLLPYERSTIADALEPKSYQDGEYIIRQGEKGDAFYILEKGRVIITKVTSAGEDPIEISRPGEGSYFGELALLNDQPRAATVQALGPLRVLCLNRSDFANLMGPCDDILKRNMEVYKSLDIEAKMNASRSPAGARREGASSSSSSSQADPLKLGSDMVEDEKTYLKHLSATVELFLVPMRKDGQAGKISVSGEDTAALFGNIEMLLSMAKQLHEGLPQGPARGDRTTWGKLFAQFTSALRFYSAYANNYKQAATNVLAKLKNNETFNNLLQSRRQTHNLPELSALLQAPIERPARYLKFLQEMQNGANDAEGKILNDAIGKIAPIAQEIQAQK